MVHYLRLALKSNFIEYVKLMDYPHVAGEAILRWIVLVVGAHPVPPIPLSLTFLSFATLAVFSALSCFLLTLLTRSFTLAPLLLLLPQSLIATLHKAVELLHRPPPLSRLPSDAFHLRYVFR